MSIFHPFIHLLTIIKKPTTQHGQFVNNHNRVDGNIGRNRRTQRTNVLECEGRYRGETLAQMYWYPGYTPANGNDPSEVLWERFGAYIRQNNFLTGNTLNPVCSKSIPYFYMGVFLGY